MKTSFIFTVMLVAACARAQQSPPPAATQAEVNAGALGNKYVSPATLAGWSGASASNTNALTASQQAALANAVTNGDTRNLTLTGSNLVDGVFTNGTFYGFGYYVGPTVGLQYKLADPFSTYDTATGGKIADAGGLWNGYGSQVYDNNGNYGAGNGSAITNLSVASQNLSGIFTNVIFVQTNVAGDYFATNGGTLTVFLGWNTNGSTGSGQVLVTTNTAAGGYWATITSGGGGSSWPLTANVSAAGYSIQNLNQITGTSGNGSGYFTFGNGVITINTSPSYGGHDWTLGGDNTYQTLYVSGANFEFGSTNVPATRTISYDNMLVSASIPASISGFGQLVASNNGDLYWVTTTHTNLVALH